MYTGKQYINLLPFFYNFHGKNMEFHRKMKFVHDCDFSTTIVSGYSFTSIGNQKNVRPSFEKWWKTTDNCPKRLKTIETTAENCRKQVENCRKLATTAEKCLKAAGKCPNMNWRELL